MGDQNNTKVSEQKNKRPMGPGGFGPGRGHGPGGFGSGEKAKDFKGTLKNLIGYLKPYKFSIIIVFIFAIASTVFTVASPRILGNMTNQIANDYINILVYDQAIKQLPKGVKIPPGTTGADVIKNAPPQLLQKIPKEQLERFKKLDLSKRPHINFASIGITILFLIGLYLLSALFSYIQGWLMTDVTQKVAYNFRRLISEKINRMPLRYFDSRPIGDVLSRITNDIDTVSQTLNQSLSQIVVSVATILGVLIMMLTISWQLTGIALIAIPLSLVLIMAIVKNTQKFFKKQQDSLGSINGHIEEMYGGHKIVKVFNGEQRALTKFNNINEDLYDSAWKSQFYSGLMWPIMTFIGNLDFVGVAVFGGYLAVKGSIGIGDIQAFIQYIQQFNQPIIQTANIVNVLQSTAAAAERVFEFLREKDESPDPANPVELKNVKGEVEFDNVVFGYDPDKTIIKGLSAKIKPGQKVAIVGPTGAGKTTLVNLLMRFYDVNKGSIKIDGIDTRKMNRADVRKLFGMVLQDSWLFKGTIKENIKYGKPDASQKELITAAKAAHVNHFVQSLPKGYNMVINEEADNISQGEKQLLTIARAMLANPTMLILDEATSSVDTRTEVLIQKAMDNLMKGRTSFVIAHRLSTIRNADLIFVMRNGNIVEQGTHKQLLAKKGFYWKLYNSQFAK